MIKYAAMLIFCMFLLFQVGCAADAYFTVRQPVQLRVTDAVRSEAVHDAEIQFVYPPKPETDPQAWFEEHGQSAVRTDEKGYVTIPVEYSWIVGGLLAQKVSEIQPDGSTKEVWHARGLLTPLTGDTDTRRDRVSGRTYWCRIKQADNTDIMSIRMTPGTVANGKYFAVRIETVGKPGNEYE